MDDAEKAFIIAAIDISLDECRKRENERAKKRR